MGNSKGDLEPHVFAIADRSYRQMMAEGRKSQSILISGESGAGKTESTKIVMSYLTTLGGMGVEAQKEGEISVMERVLKSKNSPDLTFRLRLGFRAKERAPKRPKVLGEWWVSSKRQSLCKQAGLIKA